MVFCVLREEDGMDVRSIVVRHAEGIPMWAIKKAFQSKDVRLNGQRVAPETRVTTGDEIRAYFPQKALLSDGHALTAIYEDEHVLIVEKPQGLACINDLAPLSGDTCFTRVLKSLQVSNPKARAWLCHRLDIQTGGLLLFAKDEVAYDCAMQAFKNRTIEKRYECIVKGCPTVHEALLCAYLRKDALCSRVNITDYARPGAKPIQTAYRLLDAGTCARLEVTLITGRTHQIRAHLAHIGHPILGDDKYGDRTLNRTLGVTRQMLWSTSMTFHIQCGSLKYLDGRCFCSKPPF